MDEEPEGGEDAPDWGDDVAELEPLPVVLDAVLEDDGVLDDDPLADDVLFGDAEEVYIGSELPRPMLETDIEPHFSLYL